MKRKRPVRERLYRDSVHGIIALDRASRRGRLLSRLIDTAEMQRLRRIRQLGLAYFVYHGAEHSRFTHVMGVMHIMGVLLKQLGKGFKIEPEHMLVGHVAALLHDLGHGPFSHVFERFAKKDHEEWTKEIILSPGTEVHEALSEYSVDLPAQVALALHTREYRPRVISDLLASQLDADRFDYLLRDSLMTGVKHGVFDLDRLIPMLSINPSNERLVVTEKGLYPLEKYLHARYYMYRQVYQHKTVVAAEAMLTALLKRVQALLRDDDAKAWRRGGELPHGMRGLTLPPVFLNVVAGDEEGDVSLGEYLQLDEALAYYAIGELRRADDPVLSDLAKRILGRRLFKILPTGGEKLSRAALKQLRGFIKDRGLDPAYHLLEIQSSGVGYAPYHPRSRSKNIQIEMRDGSYREAAEVSEAIAALTRLKYADVIYCAPAENLQGKRIREDLVAEMARLGGA